MQECICVGVSFLIKSQPQACNFIKQETLTQVFSSKFCEIFEIFWILMTKKRKPYTLLLFTDIFIRPANSPGATMNLPVLIHFSRFLGLSSFSPGISCRLSLKTIFDLEQGVISSSIIPWFGGYFIRFPKRNRLT